MAGVGYIPTGGSGGGGGGGATALVVQSADSTIVQNGSSSFSGNTITVDLSAISSGSGVTSINTQTGAIILAGTTNQVNVTSSSTPGTFVFSLPQNINAGATPDFNAINLTGNTNQVTLGTTNTTTVTMASLTGNRVFTLPNANSNSVQPLGSAGANQIVQYIDATGTQNLIVGSTLTVGTIVPVNTAVVTDDSINTAMNKLQGQIDALDPVADFVIANYASVAANGIDGQAGLVPSATFDDAISQLPSGGSINAYANATGYAMPTLSLNMIVINGQSQYDTLISGVNSLPINNNDIIVINNVTLKGTSTANTPILINGVTNVTLICNNCKIDSNSNSNPAISTVGTWGGFFKFNECELPYNNDTSPGVLIGGTPASGAVVSIINSSGISRNYMSCSMTVPSGSTVTLAFDNSAVVMLGHTGGIIDADSTFIPFTSTAPLNSNNLLLLKGCDTFDIGSTSSFPCIKTGNCIAICREFDTDMNSNTFSGGTNIVIVGSNNSSRDMTANDNLYEYDQDIRIPPAVTANITITLFDIGVANLNNSTNSLKFVVSKQNRGFDSDSGNTGALTFVLANSTTNKIVSGEGNVITITYYTQQTINLYTRVNGDGTYSWIFS